MKQLPHNTRKRTKGHNTAKYLVIAIVTQIAFNCLLCIWWGYNLLNLAEQTQNPNTIDKFNRIVWWEGAWFILTSFLINAAVFHLLTRDSRRSKSIQTFFASLTHDLKTPLTSLRLQAECIETENPKTSEKLNRILNDADRLEDQINRCLEWSKSESLEFTQETETLNIAKFFSNLDFIPYLSKEKISVKVEECLIHSDDHRLRLIIRILIENSLRYANKNDLEISISGMATSSKEYRLFIQDNGPGFPQDNSSESKKTADTTTSSGLGLLLVERLCKQMKARFKIENINGVRATIMFRIAS